MDILIAEDDAVSRKKLKKALENWGHIVTTATNGEEAWTRYQQGKPPMVITDWQMPGMDGLELCKRIKGDTGTKGQTEDADAVYVIMLTANDSKGELAEGLESGADDYVTKPFDRIELQARIRAGERIIRLNQEMTRLALTDALTQLPNRRAILKTLRIEESRMLRERRPVGIVMADIDHFKSFNDTYGHQTGDRVLKMVADCLAGSLRAGDQVGRWGGEEFLCVLPGADLIQCAEIAERCRAFVGQQRLTSETGEVLKVSASLGAASTEGADRLDIMTLVQQADKAMYWAKEAGRNRVKIYVSRADESSPTKP